MPAGIADLVVDFDRAAAHGDLDASSDDLRRLIGRPPTLLRDAIAAAVKDIAPVR
jgi:NAD(P)H dehydrogenase (quinone)